MKPRMLSFQFLIVCDCRIMSLALGKCDALRDLVPFVQSEKHPWITV